MVGVRKGLTRLESTQCMFDSKLNRKDLSASAAGLFTPPSFSPAVVIFLSRCILFRRGGSLSNLQREMKGASTSFPPPPSLPLKCAPPKLALVFVRERVKSGKREAERSWVLNLAAACVVPPQHAGWVGGWVGASFSLPGDAHFLSLSPSFHFH